MTDNEIKKVLECCLETRHDCSDCLLEKEVHCTSLLHKIILDLINRQQAKIERLQNTLDDVLDRQPLLVERSEEYAIKEFAERLKEKKRTFIGDEYAYDFIPSIEIDVLLAEMVGGENA